VNELSNKIEFGVMNDTEKTLLFGLFKKQFGKSYNTSEEDFRYHKFIKTLENIDTRNKEEKLSGGTASHGITKFADLSIEEFKETYLTASVNNNFVSVIGELAEVDPYEGEESYVDWIGRYTALIHDQGYCGSCWAFSVTEQLESDAVRKGLIQLNTTLSTQQIISCDSSSYG
jgi:cathepsin F